MLNNVAACYAELEPVDCDWLCLSVLVCDLLRLTRDFKLGTTKALVALLFRMISIISKDTGYM